MSRWKFLSMGVLAAALSALGCGSSSSSGVSITISPTTASVITNQTQSFSALVTGAPSNNTNVTWSLTCATGVTAGTCGSFQTTGTDTILYTAPPTLPTITSNGTTTVAPTVTITVTSQADTSKAAAATLTIVTGISINITPATATVGTNENFTFTATVSNPGCNLATNPTCENVTWSISTTPTTGSAGTIGSTTGLYTAPSSVPVPSSILLTATSVADTSVTKTATVNVVTASTPTVSSVSPSTTALGGVFQDIYITGTNFISTNVVYVNNTQLAPTFVTDVSASVIRARLPDFILASPPASGILQISVSEQKGTPVTCTPDASQCQITVTSVRPGVIGPSPDTVSQGSGVISFGVDGGFFGTSQNPAVSATYNGHLRAIQPAPAQTNNSTRFLSVTLGSDAGDFSLPGLYPVAIRSATNTSNFAVTNLAVQPNYSGGGSSISKVIDLTAQSGIGTSPNDVAINPATGMAVVANTGSNDVSLIDLTAPTPAVVSNICTYAIGLAPPCPSATPSGPTSVSVDYFRNIALVVNAASQTIAVVDLNARAVTSIIQLPLEVPPSNGAPGLTGTPEAVGINPVTGRALVAMQSRSYGILLDLTQSPPQFIGVVSISTGLQPRVAVEPHLNWAIATPGGGNSSLGIVDLSRQSTNAISTLSRTSNVVTVTIQTTSSSAPLAVQLNDAVLIQNASDSSFDGIYQVSQVGPQSTQFSYTQSGATLPDANATGGTLYYSQAVATPALTNTIQGIGINTETQEIVLADPSTGGVLSFLSLVDQSPPLTWALQTNGVTNKFGPTAAAYNPLTNTVVAVDASNNLYVVDPTTPHQLDGGNPAPTLPGPVAVAVDPGTNLAVVANQKDNSVSVFSLGSIKPFSIVETSPKTVVTTSALGSGPAPSAQTLTVIGKGLTCLNGNTTLQVRLDGNPLQTFCAGKGDRELTATVLPSQLTSAHRYALDVADASGNVTNAEDFTVEQSIDVSSPGCPATQAQPSGVAVDPQQNIAAVTLFGCNTLALINMNTGTGQTVIVGTNPTGVAVLPSLHLAVVANNGSNNASIVDEIQQSVTLTPSTGSGSMGAAADQDTQEVAIANEIGNSVSVVNAVNGGVHSVSTGQSPVAVGFDYVNHELAVAAAGSNNVGFGDASGGSTTPFVSTIELPTSVAYDPVPSDCGSNTGTTTTNTVGCFIVNSSTINAAYIIDPVTSIQNSFNIGINPTSIAYDFWTSKLVSTNTGSRTMTVTDLLGKKIRAVLPLPPPPVNSNLAINGVIQFALDIHPFENLAVVADTANGKVLFIPLPY
jgi:DNA-binding beta-propeller fold protein YncE